MEGLVIGLDLNDDYSQISCNEKEKSWTVPSLRTILSSLSTITPSPKRVAA